MQPQDADFDVCDRDPYGGVRSGTLYGVESRILTLSAIGNAVTALAATWNWELRHDAVTSLV